MMYTQVHNIGAVPPAKNGQEILTIQLDANNKAFRERYKNIPAGDGWHSDVSYELQPAGLSFLKIDTLPSVGGDTSWGNELHISFFFVLMVRELKKKNKKMK